MAAGPTVLTLLDHITYTVSNVSVILYICTVTVN